MSKLMTQALRFFSSRCSTANTSPWTVTTPMSSSRVFMGMGFFLICRVPKIRLEEKPRSASWAVMASCMAFRRRASVCWNRRSCSDIGGSSWAEGSGSGGGSSGKGTSSWQQAGGSGARGRRVTRVSW